MTIADKVNKACMTYMQNNMTSPNELWLGEIEKFELERYLESVGWLKYPKNDEVFAIDDKSKFEFRGLKVRFNKWAKSSSFLEVDYNPHYD